MNCRVRLTDVQGDRAGFADLIGKEGSLTTVAEGLCLSLDGILGSMNLPTTFVEKDDKKIVVKTRRDNTFIFAIGEGLLAAAAADKAHKEEHREKAAPAVREEKKAPHEESKHAQPEKKDVPEVINQPVVAPLVLEEKKAQPEEIKKEVPEVPAQPVVVPPQPEEKKAQPEVITQPVVTTPQPEEKKSQPEEIKPAQPAKKDATTPPAGRHERKGK